MYKIPQLFSWVFGKKKLVEKSASRPNYSAMTVQEIIDLKSFGEDDTKRPITSDQILIDSVAVTMMLQQAGYSPLNQLVLISKMYGAIVGTLKPEQTDLVGNKIDVKHLETNFFYACRAEKELIKKRKTNVNILNHDKRLH